MAHGKTSPLITVDIGNQRIKCGFFSSRHPADAVPERGLPRPSSVKTIATNEFDALENWLTEMPSLEMTSPCRWAIAGVHRGSLAKLTEWIASVRPEDRAEALSANDLRLVVAVEHPDRVGIDRLVGAYAAKHLEGHMAGWPIVTVDSGTALTVDLVGGDGAFLGGAILPGLEIGFQSLHDRTDALPHLRPALENLPPLPGRNTAEAMQAGVLWGAVGAVRQIALQLFATDTSAERPPGGTPLLVLTGGAGEFLAEAMRHRILEEHSTCGFAIRHEPELVLSGIAHALAAREKE